MDGFTVKLALCVIGATILTNVVFKVLDHAPAAAQISPPSKVIETNKISDDPMVDTDSGRTESITGIPRNTIMSKKLNYGQGQYSISEYCYDGTTYLRFGNEWTAKFKDNHTVSCQ